MAGITFALVAALFTVCYALPAQDPVISKLDSENRYQYVRGPDGTPHLVDLWMKASDIKISARYAPDVENIYHLFTRNNTGISQPLIMGNEVLLNASNFDGNRSTMVIVPGWMEHVSDLACANIVAAALDAEDLNVICVDWTAGSDTLIYPTAVANTGLSGRAVARFLDWLIILTGATYDKLHIVGSGLGAHQASVIGVSCAGTVNYVTGLDPVSNGFVVFNDNKFRSDSAAYTEVIHTNAGLLGYVQDLAHADFYPNGGVSMPGCLLENCDHQRAIYYFAESLHTDRFIGSRCATVVSAMSGICFMWGSATMGGLNAKIGTTGIYHLRTNASPPFSRG